MSTIPNKPTAWGRHSCLVGLALAASIVGAASCRDRGEHPGPPAAVEQADPQPATVIHVTADPEQVAQARQEAESREERFKDEVLGQLGTGSFRWVDSELLSRYRLRPNRITQELRRIVYSDEAPGARAAACGIPPITIGNG